MMKQSFKTIIITIITTTTTIIVKWKKTHDIKGIKTNITKVTLHTVYFHLQQYKWFELPLEEESFAITTFMLQ